MFEGTLRTAISILWLTSRPRSQAGDITPWRGPRPPLIPPSMFSSYMPVAATSWPFEQGPKGDVRPRLLVVDDDALIRRLNAMTLMRAGYEVDTSEDGAYAWDALQARDYHLMITDHNMPKLTGLDLLRKLRTKNMTLPVIMASGSLPIEEFDRHPALKPTAMLCKPYMLTALVQTVDLVLGRVMAFAQISTITEANTALGVPARC